ncbi:DUF1484 family protein [Cupriavidus sp. SK-4]|uniref:DUF1484 family protein n=1 Tax=Cupriavidus sp. SK-4 TaxID=574750 RepID=UPI001F167BC4|nr:DUF1484 family protein [Cupriavidus sp. SK-4]
MHQAGPPTFPRSSQCKTKPHRNKISSWPPFQTACTRLDVSAGLGCVLSLLEVESERSEVCHGVHCLVAMLKAQLDQTAEELLRTSELGSDVAAA